MRVLRGSHTPRDPERVFAELPRKRRWAENSVHSLLHSVDTREESEHNVQSCGKIGSREIRYLPSQSNEFFAIDLRRDSNLVIPHQSSVESYVW